MVMKSIWYCSTFQSEGIWAHSIFRGVYSSRRYKQNTNQHALKISISPVSNNCVFHACIFLQYGVIRVVVVTFTAAFQMGGLPALLSNIFALLCYFI